MRLFYLDPTQDHPQFGSDSPSRFFGVEESKCFRSNLQSIGADAFLFEHQNKISWNDCITLADAIQDNISKLTNGTGNRRYWERISKELRFSGGVRVVIPERKPMEIPPYSR